MSERKVRTSEIQMFFQEDFSSFEGGLRNKDAFKDRRPEWFRTLYKCDRNKYLEYLHVTSL